MRRATCLILLVLAACAAPTGRDVAPQPSASAAAPLLPTAFDEAEGTVTLTLPPATPDGVHGTYLLVAGIETGLGANDVGLDRGQMGRARLVRFRSVGGRVLLEEMGTGFRAEEGSALEQRAARESFASSVLWGAERPAAGADGSVELDVTTLIVRDAHGIASKLGSTGQGSYTLDAARSAVDMARCRAFPDNIELAAVLTFTSKSPGREARSTAPDGRALTFVQRQGLLRLPEPGYERRPFHPRMGAFGISYLEYGASLEDSTRRTWAVRHRLRRDPVTGAPEPLVYYVDRAAPEPVRSALVEGASWWEEAFAAAGYPGLFRVEVAPEGLDPLDARHNVIQWVHRSTRGWSYGNAVTDPRTGEIVKGHVSLGSLRVRQDRLLFEGLLGTQATGSGAPDDPVQLALARIRQLSAHEVGHTLGLAHNFAASVANRASVMDYPAPRVRPRPDGSLDVSEAYGVGVGAWDVHAIRMLYETAPADVAVEPFLARMSGEARDAGLLYLTDQDCRSAGASHPLGNLWDDGDEPISGLRNALEVRRIGLAAFGDRCLEAGRPTHELEEVLVPLYLHHRYQVDAALKVVGGRDYEHTMHGERDASVRVVPAGLQREALALLVSAAGPATLQLPRDLRDALPPRSPGAGPSREVFGRAAEASFDWLGAAEVAQRQVVRGLLQPERLARLHLQSRGEAADDQLGLAEVMGALVGAGMVVDGESGPAAALRARLRRVVIEELLGAMAGRTTPPEARDMARLVLVERLESGSLDDMPALEAAVSAALLRPAAPRPAGSLREAPTTPPGSPIGGGGGPWQGLAGAGGCSIDAD